MKRLLLLIVAITLLGSFPTICGASGEKETQKGAATGSKFSTLKAQEKATMRFTHAGASEGEKAFMVNFKKHYEAKNPNVTVDFIVIPGGEALQKLIVMTRAGDWPDVIGILDIGDLAAMKIVEPLDDFFARDDKLKKEHFIPSTLQYSQVNGVTYAVPITAMGFGLMVNTNLLGATGMKLDDIKTWDDLIKVAQAMTKGDVYGYGFCGATPRFMYRDFYISALSNGITMDKMADPANKNKMMELLAYYKRLSPYIIPNLASAEWADVHKYVIDDKMGMLTTGTYYQSYMTGLNGDCIEYIRPIAYPKGPSAEKANAYVANYAYGITTGSKHKDVAWDMIKEVHISDVGPEFTGSIHTNANITYNKEVVRKAVAKYFGKHLDAQLEILGRWEKILANGIPQPVVLGQVDIERTFQEKMLGYLSGKLSADQFYDQWMAALEKIQADLKKK